MKINVEEVIRIGNQLFTKRTSLMSLWQEIADQFYPERADFTSSRSLGTDFAANLMSSYPVLARRDLGNAFSTMLRQTSKDWFHMRVRHEEDLSIEANQWLEKQTKRMRHVMYSRTSGFEKATKQGDHDFAAFGQTVISIELNKDMDGLLYRCWHLRDVAWMTDDSDVIDTVYRKWKITARDIVSIWGSKAHPAVLSSIEKEPFREFEMWHVVLPSRQHIGEEKSKSKTPYMSCYIDSANNHLMECEGSWTLRYIIPRWQLVSGSQYAFSPATITALPDARLIQSMTRVLLESGEKAVNPPMVAVQEAIRSDISIYAGGITSVDADYDERLGEVLRPLGAPQIANMNVGLELTNGVKQAIAEAFYLNKLTLPQVSGDMTAFEVGQRVQEYIRQAMPIFEPVEAEYNGALCDMTFEILMRANAFGSIADIPEELQGGEVEFTFESPLHEAVERAKGQQFLESKALIAEAVALDPGSIHLVDVKTAIRDVLTGIKIPAEWIRSEGTVKQLTDADAQQAAQQQQLQQVQQLAETAKNAGVSASDFMNLQGVQ